MSGRLEKLRRETIPSEGAFCRGTVDDTEWLYAVELRLWQ
jgi:hypothetical protein